MNPIVTEALADTMLRTFLLSVAAFTLAMILTPVYTFVAYRYKFWKRQRTESTTGEKLTIFNKLHANKFKRNIPTMAGLVFVLAIVSVTFFFNLDRKETWLPLAALAGGALVGLIDDITNILTFDTNISAISKWRDLNNRTKNISSFFKSDDEDTPAELNDLAKTLDTAASVAVTQSVINNIQRELVENKGTSSNGYIKETSLTPDDLAVIRQQNRNTINESISYERSKINSMEAIAQVKEYKALADQVHLQIQSLIDVRPNLTKTTILVPCTMHWLSHYLYDDMSRAAEIRRLNPLIQNLSLLEKGMEVSVYAR